MNPIIHSFRLRLMTGALVWIFILTISGYFVLSEHFKDLVTDQFIDELHGHADELTGLIDVDSSGIVTLRTPMTDPLFLGDDGYYWQVSHAEGLNLRSPSLHEDQIILNTNQTPDNDAKAFTGLGPNGPVIVLARMLKLNGLPTPLLVIVSADKNNLDKVLNSYNKGLIGWLALIGVGLIGSSIAQVTFGLAPLNRVRQALAAIKTGQADKLPNDLPEEVAPLAADMNSLLDANLAIVRRARVQAGNLAHSLKTPLALLMDMGVQLNAKGDTHMGPMIIEQCQRMSRQINYQMAQARATASRSSQRVAATIRPSLENIVSGISRLYSDKDISFEANGNLDVQVSCDYRDLEDMLGNLIDNAAKWTKSIISITVKTVQSEGIVEILIEDDGPGLPLESRARVFEIGERLDEQAPGSGLGLAIVKDFADLYGGRVWIGDSEFGGAAVYLILPVAS